MFYKKVRNETNFSFDLEAESAMEFPQLIIADLEMKILMNKLLMQVCLLLSTLLISILKHSKGL